MVPIIGPVFSQADLDQKLYREASTFTGSGVHSLNQPTLEAQKSTVLLLWEKALVGSWKRALLGMTGSNGRQPWRLSVSLPQLSWGSDSVLFITGFTLAWLVLSERLPCARL